MCIRRNSRAQGLKLWKHYLTAALLVAVLVMPLRDARASFVLPPIALGLLSAAGTFLSADALVAANNALIGGIAVAAVFMTPGDSPSDAVVPLGDGQVRVPLTAAGGAAKGTGETAIMPAGGAGCGQITSVNAWGYGMWVCPGSGEASAVPSDKRYDLVRDGNAYSMPNAAVDGDTPKAGFLSPAMSGTILADNTGGAQSTGPNGYAGSYAGQDSNGNPVVVSLWSKSDGGSSIKIDTQIGGNVQTKVLHVAADGTIRQVTQNTQAGSIDYTGVQIASASGAGTGTGTGSGTGTGTSTGTLSSAVPQVQTTGAANPTTGNIDIPKDYAREATNVGISSKLTDLKNQLTQQHTAPADLEEVGITNFFNGTFSNLLNWSLPGHSSVCPRPSFAIYGTGYQMTAHCDLMDSNFGLFRGVLTAVFMVGSLFVVLKA